MTQCDRKRKGDVWGRDDPSSKRPRPAPQHVGTMSLSSPWAWLRSSLWNTSNADAKSLSYPFPCDGMIRFNAMGREGIRQIFCHTFSNHGLQRVILARRDLALATAYNSSDSMSKFVAGVAVAAMCASPIPSAAKAALMFAAAANSVLKTMQGQIAWHHFIILEFPLGSFAVHLVPEGVYVTGIMASGDSTRKSLPRSSAEVQQHRQELLMKRVSSSHIHLAEEVSVHTVDPCLNRNPVSQAAEIWLKSVVDDGYNLCKWNCQHFTQEFLAVVTPFCEAGSRVRQVPAALL